MENYFHYQSVSYTWWIFVRERQKIGLQRQKEASVWWPQGDSAFQIKEQPELEQAHGQIWMLEENWFSIIAFMKNKSLPLIAAQ